MEIVAPDRVAELGLAWAGSSVNCKPYAVEPIVRARISSDVSKVLGTFFDFRGALCAYSLSDDLNDAKVVSFNITRPPYDAHDSPVIQVDESGRIMVMASSHRSRPVWMMSEPHAGIAGLVDITSKLPEEMDTASYPSLLRLSENGSLLLLYRLGEPHRSHWRAAKWDSKSATWLPPRSILSGMATSIWSAGPYPNQPVPLPHNRFGLSYCWRSTAVQDGKVKPMNIGIDYVEFSENLSSAKTSGNISLSIPVSPSNTDRVIAIPWGAELVNQSGACVIDSGIPCFVSYWGEFEQSGQIRFCWLGEKRYWQTVTITKFDQNSTLDSLGTLPTLVSRPVVVPAGQGRVIVLYRTSESGGQLVAQRLRGPDFNPQEFRSLILVAGGLDQYEPVVERLSSVSSGWLHVYVQSCSQVVGGDLLETRRSAPARLLSWDINSLFDLNGKI